MQVIDTLLGKVVKDFSALLVSQGTQVLYTLLHQLYSCISTGTGPLYAYLSLSTAWIVSEENTER